MLEISRTKRLTIAQDRLQVMLDHRRGRMLATQMLEQPGLTLDLLHSREAQ